MLIQYHWVQGDSPGTNATRGTGHQSLRWMTDVRQSSEMKSVQLIHHSSIAVTNISSLAVRLSRSEPLLHDTGYMSRKFESLERINSIQETNENFDSCTYLM